MITYFDSHCHINDEALLPDVDEVISRAKESGVTTLFVIGWDVNSSRVAVELSSRYPNVYAMVGVHPENIDSVNETTLEDIKALAANEKVVAIGEIGLDYHWNKDPEVHAVQKEWFIKQIELANELHLPICVHARDAVGDTIAILKEYPVQQKGVLHCYSGSVESMQEITKLGFYFGFDGPITYKNAIEPKRCAALCPIDRLLVETDSPYLAPVPFRGKQNEPKNIPYIVKMIAELRDMDENDLANQLWNNLETLFHVKHE